MIPAEEQARADVYGLLARLFYAPPDAALLKAIAAQRMEGELGAAWSQLADAAAHADPQRVHEEYEEAFIGTGKAPVTLYVSAYLVKYSGQTPLAELRGQLAQFGLARREETREPEDHIAALCEVMRHLVAKQNIPLEEQRDFFNRWMAPAAEPLCAAIERSDKAVFYKHVGAVAKCFFNVEQTAFEML